MSRPRAGSILPALCLAAHFSAAACGAATTRSGEPAGPSAADPDQTATVEDEPAVSAACATSEDCAADLVCVDSECVIPVPPGFY